jgi:hypothetical protein
LHLHFAITSHWSFIVQADGTDIFPKEAATDCIEFSSAPSMSMSMSMSMSIKVCKPGFDPLESNGLNRPIRSRRLRTPENRHYFTVVVHHILTAYFSNLTQRHTTANVDMPIATTCRSCSKIPCWILMSILARVLCFCLILLEARLPFFHSSYCMDWQTYQDDTTYCSGIEYRGTIME